MPRARTEVVGLKWPKFLEMMADKWEPGDHFSLAALTKAGKSTFMAGLLGSCRQYVLALDIKGGDSILSSLGWPRLDRWPGIRDMAKRVKANTDRGVPSRFIVGPIVHNKSDKARRLDTIKRAIEDAFEMGGWTIYIDELQVAADRRMMGLEGEIAELLVSARSPKRITIASSFQAPAWVPTEAVRQPWWFGISVTRDEDMVQRLASVMGKDWHELVGAMRPLEEHMFIVVDRNPRSPFIVTQPVRLT